MQDHDQAPDTEDDAYALDQRTVQLTLSAVRAGDRQTLSELLDPLHAADIADMIEQIDSEDRLDLVRLYDLEFDGEILSEIDESLREEIIAALRPEVLTEAVRELESDDVVDLIEDNK